MALRVAELETLFTATIQDYVKKTDQVDKTNKALEKSDPTVKVKAEAKSALADMNRVQADAKKIDGTTATAKLDADASKAKAGVREAQDELKKVDGKSVFSKVGIKVDRGMARGVAKEVGTLTGDTLGTVAGKGLSAGIIGALVGVPIVGAAVGLGVAIAENLKSGLEGELTTDLLMAQTGLDAESIAPIARAAGEAYANNWGTSIAANMDTARTAIQDGLLDPTKTAADSQAIIESLAGVADMMGEEVMPVARATAQILRTGLAKDAAGAFDLIVKGTQLGVNKSEDLLDTFNEYSIHFKKIGLDGPQALGLMSQAIQGGARDSDQAADALKTFGVASTEMSKNSIGAFKAIGLDAKKMSGDIQAGGPRAAAALGLTLTKLREMKPSAEKTAAALVLFGSQGEDMAGGLNNMNLSKAVTQLGNVKGAAKSAMDTLGDNTAGKLASAQRNIEVATAGIKGALATAFAPQIAGFATFVTENRAAVMKFLLDLANGSIDAGRALANAAADGIEGFGSLVGTVGPAVMGMISGIMQGFAKVAIVAAALDPTGLLDGMRDSAVGAAADFEQFRVGAEKGFAGVKSGSTTAAAAIRTNLITNGLDPAQRKLNALGDAQILKAGLHDASVKLAKSIDSIGYAANGSKMKLDTHSGAINLNTAAGKRLDGQIRAAVGALDAEALAAAKSGEGQKALTTRYGEGRAALIKQLTQMGFTAAQAVVLANKYNAIPGKKVTNVLLNKDVAAARAAAIQKQIDLIKQHKVPGIDANTAKGKKKIADLEAQKNALTGKTITIGVKANFTMGSGGGGSVIPGIFTNVDEAANAFLSQIKPSGGPLPVPDDDDYAAELNQLRVAVLV